MHPQFSTGLVWFRRDLRTQDNAALSLALACCKTIYCVFVYDKAILDILPLQDRRVEFIHASVFELETSLNALRRSQSRTLITLHALAQSAIPALAQHLQVNAVFAARDYEPAAVARDTWVQQQLLTVGQQLILVKDQVIFEEREVLTQAGKPYGVFTPYLRAWLARIGSEPIPVHNVSAAYAALAPAPVELTQPLPTLTDLGFATTNLHELGMHGGSVAGERLLQDFVGRIDRYGETRNFPAVKGPSYLGVHLRFGTLSIRRLVNIALERVRNESVGATTWLAELAWRDFYFQILANHPHVATQAFKPEYDDIAWEKGAEAETLLRAWREGCTGYPIVDAAMAQLNQTGYMHNRLRMIAGSFLVKHLGLDWRWGEQYFALQLNDYDLAANNGGWQWVASSGCDAQPYFRIFNPVIQSEKFDGQGKFIKRYLPQLAGLSAKSIHAPWLAKPIELAAAGVEIGNNYPAPIVNHTQARARTLARYGFLKKLAA